MDSASSESEGDPPTPSGPSITSNLSIPPTPSTPNKLEYEIRVFWAGDSRAVLIKSSPSNHDQIEADPARTTPSDHTAHSNTSSTSTTSTIPNDTDSDSTTTTTSTVDTVSTATDSQSDRNLNLLHRRGRPLLVELTNDHRPDNPAERSRIESAHGVVINNRVDSKLAVSRAFGDCTLKNNKSLQFRQQRVTSLTETRRIIASHGDELFLFCDGLVEYLDNERLIDSLYRHIPLYQDPVYALGFLFDEVLEGGSRDNMSAILVQFADGTSYGVDGRQKTFLPGPLYLTRNDKKYVAAYLSNAKDFGHRDSPQLRRAAYREDLKFLRKYGLQRHGHGMNEKAIIREIQQVIRDIDAHTERERNRSQNGHESKGDGDGVADGAGGRRGSTEMIRDEEDQAEDQEMKDSEYGPLGDQDMTPPLSDEDEEEENEIELNVHSPNTSKSEIDGDGKPQMTRKRTFADLQDVADEHMETDGFPSKRRKSNIGNVIVNEQRSQSELEAK